MENNLIIEWLEKMFPDRLPFNKVDDYELGVLIGQRQLIEQLKVKLKVAEKIEEEIK